MSVADSVISRNGWLWWKEFRMLTPLVGLLLGLALVMFLIHAMTDSATHSISYSDDLRLLIPLIFPNLFAAGAGAVLIGQERELRTIDWMASLPLPPRQWIVVKLIVAAIGLLAMWAFAALCLLVFNDGHGSISRWRVGSVDGFVDAPVGYPLWILYSIYLTLCGFYAAWRIRNQFHALVAVLALACLPLATAELVRWLFDGTRRLSGSDVQTLTFALTAILIPTIGWLAYRAALNTLLPQVSPTGTRTESTIPTVETSFWSTAPNLGSCWASMIWQSVRSAPLALGLTVAIVIAGTVLPLLILQETRSSGAGFLSGLLIFLGPLAMSWLGVLVFQNDGSAERVRFLADRGVAPTKVYLSRHAVPLAALASCLIVYTILASISVSAAAPSGLRPMIPSLLTVALVGWVMYSVSQWTSQLFRTLVLSVIVSPIVATMILGWFIYAHTMLQTPIWMLAACSLLPIIATWWLMPRFMDMRDRPYSFVIAAAIIATMIAVPIGFVAWQVTGIPLVASSERSALLAEGQTVRRRSKPLINISIASRDNEIFSAFPSAEPIAIDRAMQWINEYPATPGQWIPALAEIREQPGTPASMDSAVLAGIFHRLMYQRIRFVANGDWESFSPWLVAASQITNALRHSTRWTDQDFADVIEIWITDTMTLPMVASHRSDEAYQQAISQLPDKRSRNQARRDAVLATWAGQDDFQTERVTDRGLQWESPYLATWMQDRRTELIVATALSALAGSDPAWLRRMHEFQIDPSTPYQYGPYSPRFRDLPAIRLIRSGTFYPARYWGMAWEDATEKLIQETRP